MELSAWKLRLSVLWLFQLFNFIAVLLVPYSADIVKAQIGDALGGLIVFYIFLTCLMLWLTLVVKPAISRWAIMVIGVFFAFVKFQWLARGISNSYSFEFVFNEAWGLAAAATLVWYGWKAPKTAVNS